MQDYQSKYSGEEIDALLDKAENAQERISDLEDIRDGASRGATSVQGVKLNGDTITRKDENGIVDLGEIKVDEAKFANDLTGVVEATPEMFTYRPSAGDKSVRDESAVIRRIKGHTSVWGQYVRNGNFAEGTRYSTGVNTTLSNNDDGSINIVNKGSGSDGISQRFLSPIPAKHKVLIVMDYKRSSTAVSNIVFYLTKYGSGIYDKSYIYSVSSDSRRVDSAILETTNETDMILVYPFIKGVAGEYVTMYSYMAIDLTAIFGAGNEPTTYKEFRQYYPDAYYPYCLPEVRAMRVTGVETIGFNQWDEQWENGSFNTADGANISNNQIRCKNLIRIFPNTYYSLSIGDKNLGIWAMFYDENLNILQPVNLNSSVSRNCLYISPSGNRNVFLTPENASWMKFYTPSEYGSTTYKGDICINLSHSGVRNGEYKPYEKNTLLLPEIAKYFPDGMHAIGDVYDEINEEMAIQRCAVRAYEEGDENNAEVNTDKRTTVYKLSESIHTPIDELLQLDYKVDDFGTEKMLSNAPSAPFKADIVYQFNAEGRIRDNSRNIEKLEDKVKSIAENSLDTNTLNGATAQLKSDIIKGYLNVKPTVRIFHSTDPNKSSIYAYHPYLNEFGDGELVVMRYGKTKMAKWLERERNHVSKTGWRECLGAPIDLKYYADQPWAKARFTEPAKLYVGQNDYMTVLEEICARATFDKRVLGSDSGGEYKGLVSMAQLMALYNTTAIGILQSGFYDRWCNYYYGDVETPPDYSIFGGNRDRITLGVALRVLNPEFQKLLDEGVLDTNQFDTRHWYYDVHNDITIPKYFYSDVCEMYLSKGSMTEMVNLDLPQTPRLSLKG